MRVEITGRVTLHHRKKKLVYVRVPSQCTKELRQAYVTADILPLEKFVYSRRPHVEVTSAAAIKAHRLCSDPHSCCHNSRASGQGLQANKAALARYYKDESHLANVAPVNISQRYILAI